MRRPRLISGFPPGHHPPGRPARVDLPLDPYLSLKTAAAYTSLSVRTLRSRLTNPHHPLPCYRLGGKILLKRSDLDRWLDAFRSVGAREQALDKKVDEILGALRADPHKRG